MTYTEFKNKWLGKPINFDSAYGAQCMDVYRQYVKEVLLCPQSPSVAGAKDVWNTYLPEYFDRIANSPTGVPQEGDIVIWGMLPYGHIAICDHATTSTLTCFEQNWVEQDGSGVSELRLHGNYNNVLGWLRFKKPLEVNMTEEEKRILSFLKERGAGEAAVREAFGALADIQILSKELASVKKLSENLSSQVTDLTLRLAQEEQLSSDWQTQLKTANKTNQNLTTELEYYRPYKALYDKALKTTIDKYSGWQLIKMGVSKLAQK